MSYHHVETCPDDPTLLAERLDQIASTDARIINVTWQPIRSGDQNQAEALDARGSFIIISQRDVNHGVATARAANAFHEPDGPATLVAANTPEDKISA